MSAYSGSSGRRQRRSPVASPAASTASHQASSLPIRPACTGPNVVTMPPVSVARSTRRSAPRSIACVRQSASTRRPSASVLLISIVTPARERTMSPGRIARPETMFSAAPTTETSRAGRPEPGDRARGLEHRGAAAHVELHLVHARGGLDRVAARVERHRLADEPERRSGDVVGLVGERDEPRLGVRAARDGGERAHARRLDLRPAHDLHRERRRGRPASSRGPRGEALGRHLVGAARCRGRAPRWRPRRRRAPPPPPPRRRGGRRRRARSGAGASGASDFHAV